MTEVTKKALALVDEVIDQAKRGAFPCRILPDADGLIVAEALCRAIEQHEAFKREVSEVCRDVRLHDGLHKLDRFILPKPDPLVEAWQMAFPGNHIEDARDECAKISAAIKKRGGKIVWGEG